MIKISPLGGLVPKADGRGVVGQAEIAENIDFSDGYARAWCEPMQIAEAPECQTPFIHDGRVRFGPRGAQFHKDEASKLVYMGDPCDCVRVYKDWCSDDDPIALGLPIPATPTILSADNPNPDDLTDWVGIVIRYVNENCPGCPTGAISAPSNQVKCKKDDVLDVAIPPLTTNKYEVTHVEIYRLATTWDSSTGMHDPARDGFVGDNLFGGFETAVSAAYFRVGRYPISVSGSTVSFDCSLPIGDALMCEDNFPPPATMCLAGETTRGSLVGYFDYNLLFSQRNMYHGWPQQGVLSFGSKIADACIWGDTVFVLLECGELYIVLDDVTGAETGECRTVRLIRKTRRKAGDKFTKQSYCDHTGYTWISDEGIMRASLDGNVVNMTWPWFGYREWLQTVPSKMTLAEYRGALFFSGPAYSGVLDMNTRGEIVSQSFIPTHSTLTICPDCWITDCDGRLYFVSCGILWEFNAGSEYMRMRWRSTLISKYSTYGVGLIDFAGMPKTGSNGKDNLFTISTYHKGQTVHESVDCSRDRCCFRFRRRKAHDVQLQFDGTQPVRGLCAGASMTGLQSAAEFAAA